MDERQAEARSRSNTFRREEGVEHAIEHLGIDAGTRVSHSETNIRTGRQLAMEHRTALANVDPVETHLQNAAGRHRLHGVRAQVHHDLMELRRIGDHGCVAGFELAFEPNAARQRRGKQVECFTDRSLNVDRRAVADTAAAERENALDERLRPARRVHDIVDIASHGTRRRRTLLRELPVSQDRAQNIVEVVRDAAGQRAHRLQLLRLA